MIRINLLEKRQEAPAKSSAPKVTTGGVGGMLALAIILLGLLGIGVRWKMLDRKIDGLKSDVAAEEAKIDALKKELASMNEYQAKKAALEKRVQIISDLKRRQDVPVLLLDMVSRQVPDALWLDQMTENAGTVSLTGRATTYNAVSNFYNNLRDSAFFTGVALGTTQKVREGVSFQLSCTFKPPQPGQEVPAYVPGAPGAPANAAPATAPAAAPVAATSAAPRG